ncbi:MAG: tRNA glutamyl-Q(34) synthetase GluQRS, partial [Burkholderiales bacterium]|nr:tRNA glutamyl-Q(34) synthetase GluQRS [Burkholderiales bacterium]
GPNGEKLSKQNGAMPLDVSQPLACLRAAGQALGFDIVADSVPAWLERAIFEWQKIRSVPPAFPP